MADRRQLESFQRSINALSQVLLQRKQQKELLRQRTQEAELSAGIKLLSDKELPIETRAQLIQDIFGNMGIGDAPTVQQLQQQQQTGLRQETLQDIGTDPRLILENPEVAQRALQALGIEVGELPLSRREKATIGKIRTQTQLEQERITTEKKKGAAVEELGKVRKATRRKIEVQINKVKKEIKNITPKTSSAKINALNNSLDDIERSAKKALEITAFDDPRRLVANKMLADVTVTRARLKKKLEKEVGIIDQEALQQKSSEELFEIAK